MFDPSNFKIGDIIAMPQFLSTSFSKHFYFRPFIKTNTVLLKIKINKKNKKWVFVD